MKRLSMKEVKRRIRAHEPLPDDVVKWYPKLMKRYKITKAKGNPTSFGKQIKRVQEALRQHFGYSYFLEVEDSGRGKILAYDDRGRQRVVAEGTMTQLEMYVRQLVEHDTRKTNPSPFTGKESRPRLHRVGKGVYKRGPRSKRLYPGVKVKNPFPYNKSLDQYEMSEIGRAQKEIREVEKAPLADRKEGYESWKNALKNQPEIVAERVGWLLNGSYGQGAYIMPWRAVKGRGNVIAQLAILAAAFERHCPNVYARKAFNELAPDEQANVNGMISKEIREMEEEQGEDNPPEIRVGDTVKINMSIVSKHDNVPPYIRLVRTIIRDGGGTAYVSNIEENGMAEIVSHSGVAFLPGAFVPVEALTKVSGNPSRIDRMKSHVLSHLREDQSEYRKIIRDDDKLKKWLKENPAHFKKGDVLYSRQIGAAQWNISYYPYPNGEFGVMVDDSDTGTSQFPTYYPWNKEVAYDFPERIPVSVKREVKKLFREYHDIGSANNPHSSRSRYQEIRLESPRHFDRRSFRYKKLPSGDLILVGCPTGKYDAKKKRCKVGTRGVHELKVKRRTSNPWVDVDYWAVFEEDPKTGLSSDTEIFRGTEKQAKEYAKRHGGVPSHVILENQ